MPPITSNLALRQARSRLLKDGVCPEGMISEHIRRSWLRSQQAGLMPIGRLFDDGHADGATLRHARAGNHELLAHSRPVMEYLLEQVRPSQGVVVLAQANGLLLDTLGDPGFLSRAERIALASGASWAEAHRGTNAIGTAIADHCDTEVHGHEHYLERNGFLTCAASPICAADGRLLGILDVSGDHRAHHPHTLALVASAARMIENGLTIATEREVVRLHLHAHPEGLGGIAEAILLLGDDGWVQGANRAAQLMLGVSRLQFGRIRLDDLIDARLDQLLANLARLQRVRRRDGALLHVRLQLPASYAKHGAVTSASPSLSNNRLAHTSTRVRDALDKLDTGDARWARAIAQVRKVMTRPIPILLQGETGVGKDQFARAVHESGERRAGEFVAVNCAALPEHLIESELFGYAPGAFTGARRDGYCGRLREADGGTLFLDEIGDMPLGLQSRLLRVLQEREVTPLAGASVKVDFALICASHCDLQAAVDAGRFRSDLYYRINGLLVELPPLREREDFSALARNMLESLAAGQTLSLAPELEAQFGAYRWPGNLRQLHAILRTACAMLDPGEVEINWWHLPEALVTELTRQRVSPGSAGAGQSVATSGAAHNLDELSRQAITRCLEACRGNVSEAARLLGISRQTLYRRLAQMASVPPSL